MDPIAVLFAELDYVIEDLGRFGQLARARPFAAGVLQNKAEEDERNDARLIGLVAERRRAIRRLPEERRRLALPARAVSRPAHAQEQPRTRGRRASVQREVLGALRALGRAVVIAHPVEHRRLVEEDLDGLLVVARE